MKKTLLITLDFPPRVGGVATYLSKMCEHMDPSKIVVLANREKNSFLFDEQQKYTIHRRPLLYSFLWPRWLKTFFIAQKIIKEEGIEQVIISHVVPMGYVAFMLGLPFFVIAHGYDLHLAESNPWKAHWLKKILKNSQGLIANSNYTKKLFVEGGGEESKITIAYPCPQFESDHVDEGKKNEIIQKLGLQDKKVLLTISRLVERKGVDMVLESLPQLIDKHPQLHYVVVGEGPYREKLELLVKKLVLENHVTFSGTIPKDSLAEYYTLADVFIMPARAINEVDVEGFGIVYLEANLFGLAVIGGRSGGVSDAVVDGETGLLVDPRSVSDIQGAIDMLLSEPDIAKKYGDQGKARVLSEFSWDKQFNKIINIL